MAGGTLSFLAATGVANNLTVARSGGFYLVRDLAAPVQASSGCVQTKTNVARCAVSAVSSIEIDSGDGNDRAMLGDDVDGRLDGGAGNDQLWSGTGDAGLQGGAGNDMLTPGTGTDVLAGGDGADTASYADRTASSPVVVDIDGLADDGNSEDADGAGVRDNVQVDVERLIGGAGADDLTGSAIANRLTGGGGEDILRGLAGSDMLFASGDGGADTVLCGQGAMDHAFADPVDTVSTAGPERCEFVN